MKIVNKFIALGLIVLAVLMAAELLSFKTEIGQILRDRALGGEFAPGSESVSVLKRKNPPPKFFREGEIIINGCKIPWTLISGSVLTVAHDCGCFISSELSHNCGLLVAYEVAGDLGLISIRARSEERLSATETTIPVVSVEP